MGDLSGRDGPGGDHTRISLRTDPTARRMRGTTAHGGIEFDVPFISRVHGDLYLGGCAEGLVLPDYVRHLVSLYPWERYRVRGELDSELYVKAYDAGIAELAPRLEPLVDWTLACLRRGATLVHCQAGLNRSGLVAALVLVRQGVGTPEEVLALLRERRSPAVLCNKEFEAWLLGRGGRAG